MPRFVVPALSLVLLLAGVYPLASVLDLRFGSLALALFLMLFVCGFVMHAIEGLAFHASRPVARHFAGAAAGGALTALALALLVSSPSSRTIADAVASFFAEKGSQGAWLRIALSAIAFMVTYTAIGSMVWPLVRTYYQDPKHGLGLRVPNGLTVISLQLGRGLLVTLALLPVLTSPRLAGPGWWGRLALAFAVLAAVLPLLNAPQWPTRLRVIHALEITVFAIVQSYAWWKLFAW